MKLLIFSDSHGDTFTMREALKRNRDADYAIHAGDGADDFMNLMREFPTITPVAVRGNCDIYANDIPLSAKLTVEGVNVMIAHGHKYGVKFSLLQLRAEAYKNDVGLFIFGHTHEKKEKYYPADGDRAMLYLFNPGTARAGDFGLADIKNGQILLSHGNVFD